MSKTKGKKGCDACKLFDQGAINPKMKYTGEGQKGIYFLAEAPGYNEDQDNYQLHKRGKSGKFLRGQLKLLGIDLDLDAHKDNAIRCRPPDNRTPTNTEIAHCRPFTFIALRELKPSKIILLGKPATQSFLAHRTKVETIGEWVGWKIPDQDVGAWVYPMYHPQYVLRDARNKALRLKFRQHLKAAITHDEPFPDHGDEASKVELVTNTTDALSLLSKLIAEKAPFAIDWETTGLKPQARGHRILTGAISISPNSAWAFPMFNDKPFLRRLKRLLTNPEIEKYAQNVNMELRWANHCLGHWIEGFTWDTMLATHVLDNRPNITSLKFQAYAQYGILGYDDEMKKYLPKSKDGNAFNRLAEMPQDELLTYNGMDAMFTYRLTKDQQKQIGKTLTNGNQLLLDGAVELCHSEEAGLHMDLDYCADQMDKLQDRLVLVNSKLDKTKEVKAWNKKHPNKNFNPNSDSQMKELLYDILKYDPADLTGRAKVDADVMNMINTPFSNNVLRFRKTYKVRNTYIKSFIRETVGDTMHPGFPLHFVKTYRGSSRNPNFTNIPMRDPQSRRITRRAIKPGPGHQLLDVDYEGAEVCVAACYTQDPELVKYVTDPTTDMHRDEAMEIFMLGKDQMTKPIRDIGKSQWVFPQFYGSYYANCAKAMWRSAGEQALADGLPLRRHLRDMGIRRYSHFESHVEDREHKFWNVKFREYTKWKNHVWKKYERTGYVELLTGFRCSTLMDKKDVSNYPIQGAAFHCLLWSIIQLGRLQRQMGWASMIVGQIHDSMVWDAVPDELAEIKPYIRRVMCEDLREEWPWIIVPLNIEATTSEIDGNWYDVHGVAI
jgi:uracil-DNA glycosylase family 4